MQGLNYAVFTDPAPLQTSTTGTVYVTVANTRDTDVLLHSIVLEVPTTGTGALTDDVRAITTGIETDYKTKDGERDLEFRHHNSPVNEFWAAVPDSHSTLPAGGSITLTLGSIPVSATPGLSRLKIRETTFRKEGTTLTQRTPTYVSFGIPKTAPKTVRNFRPDKTMVYLQVNETVTLRWDGPDNLEYRILDAGGQTIHTEKAQPKAGVAEKGYAWQVTPTPKRDTTYTLVAGTTNNGRMEQGHFLTTTVSVRDPEFDKGIFTPYISPLERRGFLNITPQGLWVRSGEDGEVNGVIQASRGLFSKDVRANMVAGREPEAGTILFPPSGIRVGRGEGNEPGYVSSL